MIASIVTDNHVLLCHAQPGLHMDGTSIVYRGSNNLKIKEQTLSNRWNYEILEIGYHVYDQPFYTFGKQAVFGAASKLFHIPYEHWQAILLVQSM